MPIKLGITGQPAIEIDVENITIGSDPNCTLALDDSTVMPRHAVIRKIAGRWLIEVREATAVFVAGPYGHTEAKRLHWLVPDDQIRLTENGPAIVFEPSKTDSVPVLQPGPKSRTVEDVIDEVLMLREADKTLTETTTTAAHKSSNSNPISSMAPPSTYATHTVDTIKQNSTTVNSPATTETGLQLTGNFVSNQPPNDEPTSSGPVLTRVSWNEGDSLAGDVFFDDKLTPEQAEIRWIIAVVLRCAGVGLVVLVLWLTGSAIMKSSPATKDSSLPAAEQTTETTREVTSIPTEQGRPAAVQNAKQNPQREHAETKTKMPPTSMPGSLYAERTSDDFRPAKTAKAVKPNSLGNNRKTIESTPDESLSEASFTSNSPSPLIQAVQEGIYAVFVEDFEKSRRIQIGTAWAASHRHLVTTATVVKTIEEYQQSGMSAFVVQFANGTSLRVKNKRMHETYMKALESAEDAREKHDDERYLKDRATQLRFDLGVLDIGRNERLPSRLKISAEQLEDSSEINFAMVGLPFRGLIDDASSVSIASNSLMERHSKKLAAGTPLQDKEMGLTIQFPLDANRTIWSGSPVLNRDQRVIGVYSQLLPSKPAGNKPIGPIHGVVWIGRLNEFASEIENSIDIK